MSELNEYSALHNGSLSFDRSDRLRIRISGPKAAELVTGMVTSDVSALVPGEGQYAAALTAKGKIVADLRIFALDEALLIDTSAAAAPGWKEMVRKYINPRIAPYHDVTSEISDIGVFGRSSRVAVSRALDVDEKDIAALAPYAHIQRPFADATVIIARVPEIDLDGFEIFAPASVVGLLKEKLETAGGARGTKENWGNARIEGGRPGWGGDMEDTTLPPGANLAEVGAVFYTKGVDMDDTTLPQEANFDELGAISYTKGCYIGQETVARVHFRGHVNRFLRRLRFVTRPAPPKGAELVDETGKVIGEVKSAALSPR